jgi:ornithine cyclodeaminase/alanine dehydrogenase-like protein (mu-crystallin family)
MTNKATMRYLNREEVRKCLTMEAAIQAMRPAFEELSTGKAEIPQRIHMNIPERNSLGLYMPAYLPSTGMTGVKMVSISRDNPGRGLPLIHALVLVADAGTGTPLAIMDGGLLTAIRTGAGSGLATELLARESSEVAAIFGAGVQGRTQLEAICTVRNISRAFIFDIDTVKAKKFAEEMSDLLGISVRMAKSDRDVLQADVICTATTSARPVFKHDNVKQGAHINGVGSHAPEMYEIPLETVANAKVVVDSRAGCLAEAGDLIIPLEQGLIDKEFIHSEIGEIIAGQKEGRTNDEEITFFKSVGNAVQDLSAAAAVLEAAERLDLGKDLTF